MSPTQPARRSPDAFDSRPAPRRDVGAELDNIFRLTTPAAEREPSEPSRPQAPQPEQRHFSQSDVDTALSMLNRAAQAMDILQARYHQVESYARDIAERAERDLALAYGQKKEWETRALSVEARLEQITHRMEEAERLAELAHRRSEKAERRADLADDRADAAERGASEAREWLECFHDKIVASFDTRPFPKSAAA